MDLVHFVSEKVSPAITRIRDGSDVCEYLIEGNERAALIDTGYGIGDLKGYVESLTKKPYDVFITHGHVDHAAGAYQFSKVRMHPADVELAARHCKVEFRKEMVENHAKLVLPETDYQPQRLGDFTALEDGEAYDLGGVALRWIHVPGHTQGTMVALIEEERTIMFGDACGVGVLLALPESSSVETYLKSLKKLKGFEPEYDKVLRQHGTCQSTLRVLDDNIENCEAILAGTDDAVSVDLFGKQCRRARAIDAVTGNRLDGKEGNILYDPNRLR